MNLSSGYGTPRHEHPSRSTNANILFDSIQKLEQTQKRPRPSEIQTSDNMAIPSSIEEIAKILTPSNRKIKDDSINYGDLSLNDSNDLGHV